MTFEITSVLMVAALVVNLSGALFILETLLRRDEGAGRIWALGYLAAMLMTLAYVLWTQRHDTWWAIAVGNGTLVASLGCMWLGCRMYNGRRMTAAVVGVAALSLLSTATVLIEGPAGGDWAAAPWMFVSLVILSGAAAIECLRDALLESRTAWILAFALGGFALYYVSRTTAFLTSGPESALFQSSFGTIPTSLITVGYTIVAVVCTSVLRAARAPMRGFAPSPAPSAAGDDIVGEGGFLSAMQGLCDRARAREETVGVIVVRVDDLEQIATAFGSEAGRAVATAWRRGVRRHAPSNAFVGEDGPGGLAVGVLIATPADARRQAAAIYRGVFDELGRTGHGVIPVMGVGVGLSDSVGYDAVELVRVARDAAVRAGLSVETSVLLGDDAGSVTGP